jgi:PAS domain S-box-containing protein
MSATAPPAGPRHPRLDSLGTRPLLQPGGPGDSLAPGRDNTALRRAEDEHRHLFERNPAPMAVYVHSSQRLVAVNDAFCALYGWSAAEALQLEVADLQVPERRAEARAAIPQMQGLLSSEWRHQRRDGTVMQVLVQSHDLVRDGQACRVVVITDITRLHRSRQRDQSRLRLMDSLIRGDALQLQLHQLALDHEAAFPGSLCSVLLLDEAGQHLQHGAAPSLPAFFNQAVHGLAIGPASGTCGASAHSAERVISADIGTDPRWADFRGLAQQAGLAACWSTPVLGAGGQVLGTFAVYRRQPAQPDEDELDHASFAAGLAALAIGQQRSARRLRESERRLADTLHAVPDPIWLQDSQGRLQLGNAAYRRLVGPALQAVDAPLQALLAANQAALHAHSAAVAASGLPATAERWLRLPAGGQPALFELVGTPMRDAQGQHAGALGVARDITQIKQGAQALADQARLVDTMFSQTTDAIVLVDPQSQVFVTFNDAACNGLGYSRDEFASLRTDDLQAEPAAAALRARVAQAMAGARITFENTHRRRDGSLQHVQSTLRRLDYAGRLLLSVVWQDVTESRLHADRIRRLNQAYAVLSGANEAIVRLQDGSALLAEVCRIAVDLGGFRQAWIGRPDAGAAGLLTEARAGGGAAEAPPWSLQADAAMGDAQQLLIDPPDGAGRSVAAFPIQAAGRARSVLALQADGPVHFDPDQLALYGRLVRDVGHAIESIAGEAARRREQRLREQLMESVAGLFFVLGPDGRLLLWNQRFETITGRAHGAVRGSHAGDYFAPAARPQVLARLAQVMGGQELQAEAPLLLRDGRQVPYLLMARRVDLETGPVLVGTGIDIADRVRADRELQLHRRHLEQLVAQRTAELEQVNRRLGQEDLRLRAMLSLSQRAAGLDEAALWQHGIDALVGLVGSGCGSLQAVAAGGALAGVPVWSGGTPAALQLAPADSPAALALAGLHARALQGQVAVQAVLALDGVPQRATAVPVQDQGRSVMVVCVLHPVAGPRAQADAAAVPTADDAVPPGLPRHAHDLALAGADLWDIVQRRRTEIALAQAKAAADAASHAKSAFLANMSHEIRTPLNAVLGFAHLLQREPLSPRQLDHLGKIADASQHLLQVINDILDFSKIEASKVQLDPTDFALQPCLQRMAAMVADKARANQVLLQLDLDPAAPALVHGDRMRLEQILLNLLSNAVKFTPGGQVALRVAPLAQPAAGWLQFDVADTGIGIDEAQLPMLFKPFEQADASTTRRFGGTGLGLAICHRLAQLMGGRIGVTSRLGQGSRFRLELPLPAVHRAAAALPPAALPQPLAARPLDGLRVLLAEDNPVNQEVALELLSAQGARVDVADDGQMALQRASQSLYDLVLMDVQMPRLDGLRAAAAIRQLPGWARVPIVAMTASAFPEDRADCLAAGMDDVLVKPVEPAALTQCLLHWRQASADAAPPAAVPAPAASQPAATLRENLQALRRLLQSHDTEAAEHLVRHDALLRAALGPQHAALAADVQGYAFAAALVRVDALLAGLPG